MSRLQLSYHLIPDGTTTIVEVELKGEFYASTANAVKEAEDGIVKMVGRFTGELDEVIREQMEAGKWLGEGRRPEEPTQ